MPIKTQLKFGCYKLKLGQRLLSQHMMTHCPKSMWNRYLGALSHNCQVYSRPTSRENSRRCYANAPVQKDNSDPKWNIFDLKLDIQRCEDKTEELSLPVLIYLYGPWKLLSTKWNFWKLKFLWDWSFVESNFMDNSKQAALVITDLIRHHSKQRIERCTTPMGFKQISHDLFHDWRFQLMRFEPRHICRAIPLKAQLLRHYDHKFAFIDVIFVALRRADDFDTPEQQCEMQSLIDIYANEKGQDEEAPLVFSEIFVRFRRDYSEEKSRTSGQWLISSYKVIQFDIVKYHPEYEIAPDHPSLTSSNELH